MPAEFRETLPPETNLAIVELTMVGKRDLGLRLLAAGFILPALVA